MTDGRKRPAFIGLTGVVASGKSTALAELERLGAATLSTDRVVHDLYGDPRVIELVAERLGDHVVRDGEIDRDAVAAEIFNAPEHRTWLEQTLWPRVGSAMFAWRAAREAEVPPPRALVIEVPLLFESGMDQAFDATIVITVDDRLRRERAQARGSGVSELDGRDARHLTQTEKIERADYSVANDGEVRHLAARLARVLTTIENTTGS